MNDLILNNFTVIDSIYGKFIVNRHCHFQAEALVKTGRPHIEEELQKILTIIGSLPSGAVIVDAGANIGLVAIPIARAVRDRGGVVNAYEAQRMLFYALCGSAAINDLDNFYAYNIALGNATATIDVPKPNYAIAQDLGLVSLVEPPADQPTEKVLLRPLGGVGLSRLDFLKIDVEGMEIDVLKGAEDLIRTQLPWCWIEYWKVGIPEIKQQFAGSPYKFFVMDKLNLLCAPEERLAASRISIAAPEA
jgi:FkbM family methyltransferase